MKFLSFSLKKVALAFFFFRPQSFFLFLSSPIEQRAELLFLLAGIASEDLSGGAAPLPLRGGKRTLHGFEKMTMSSSPTATSLPVKVQCSIDGGGNDNSFSFASTALSLSCEELPPSPCLRGVRGSKVRGQN